jgi:predicted O-methyltransferase YrrM
VLSVREKIAALGERNDEARWTDLRRLARLTALKHSPVTGFHEGHWWRGPLLYSLVRRDRPAAVLEVGTGRGYAAVCMAQAAADGGFPCTVWTIDRIPPDRAQVWPLDEGEGPAVRALELEAVWARYVPPAIREKIRLLTGDSAAVMQRIRQTGSPRFNLCFIDGSHDYVSVKRDFVFALSLAGPHCTFVFDDHTERRGFGVTKVIERDVVRVLGPDAVEIIDMQSRDRTVHGEDVPHRMVLLPGQRLGEQPLTRLFPSRSTALAIERWYGLLLGARRFGAATRAATHWVRASLRSRNGG